MAFKKDNGVWGYIFGNNESDKDSTPKRSDYYKPDPPANPSVSYNLRKKTKTKKELERDDYNRWRNERETCCDCGRNEPVAFPTTGRRGYCLNCAPDDLLAQLKAEQETTSSTGNTLNELQEMLEYGWSAYDGEGED